MPELATKTDLLAVRTDLLAMQKQLQTEIRSSFVQLRNEIRTSFAELRNEIALTQNSLEIFELRLTIRLGVMFLLTMWAAVIIMKCV